MIFATPLDPLPDLWKMHQIKEQNQMTKETILFTAIDRHYGALQFQANLLSRLNNSDIITTSLAIVLDAMAKASEVTATEIRCWESEQLKKIAEPKIQEPVFP